MMAGSVLIGVPLIVLAIPSFGIAGATAVWLLHGLSDITLGLWLMHRRLLKGQLLNWYRSVLLPPLMTAGPLIAAMGWLMPTDPGRWAGLAWGIAAGVFALGISSIIQQQQIGRAGRT